MTLHFSLAASIYLDLEQWEKKFYFSVLEKKRCFSHPHTWNRLRSCEALDFMKCVWSSLVMQMNQFKSLFFSLCTLAELTIFLHIRMTWGIIAKKYMSCKIFLKTQLFSCETLGFYCVVNIFDKTMAVCNMLISLMDTGEVCTAAGEVWDDFMTFWYVVLLERPPGHCNWYNRHEFKLTDGILKGKAAFFEPARRANIGY